MPILIEQVVGLNEKAADILQVVGGIDLSLKRKGIDPRERLKMQNQKENMIRELEGRNELIISVQRAIGVKNVLLGYTRSLLEEKDVSGLESLDRRDHNEHHYRHVSKMAEIVCGNSAEYIYDSEYAEHIILAKMFAETHDITQFFTGEKDGHEKMGILYMVASLCWARDELKQDLPKLQTNYAPSVAVLGEVRPEDLQDPTGLNFFITTEDMNIIRKYAKNMGTQRVLPRDENDKFLKVVRKFERVQDHLYWLSRYSASDLSEKDVQTYEAVFKTLEYSYYLEAQKVLTDRFMHDLAILINWHSEPQLTFGSDSEAAQLGFAGDTFLMQPQGVKLDYVDLGKVFDEAVLAALKIKANKAKRRGEKKVELPEASLDAPVVLLAKGDITTVNPGQEIMIGVEEGLAIIGDNEVLPQIYAKGGIISNYIKDIVTRSKDKDGKFLNLDRRRFQKMKHKKDEKGKTHTDRLHRTLISLCALPDKLDSLWGASGLRTLETSQGKRPFWQRLTHEMVNNYLDSGLVIASESINAYLLVGDLDYIRPHEEIAIRAYWAATQKLMEMCDLDRILYELRRSYNDLILVGEHRVQKVFQAILMDKIEETLLLIDTIGTGNFSHYEKYFDMILEKDLTLLRSQGAVPEYIDMVKQRAQKVKSEAQKIIEGKMQDISSEDIYHMKELVYAAKEYIQVQASKTVKMPGPGISLFKYITFFGGIANGKRPYKTKKI